MDKLRDAIEKLDAVIVDLRDAAAHPEMIEALTHIVAALRGDLVRGS